MTTVAWTIALLTPAAALYAYVGYPFILLVLTRLKPRPVQAADPAVWPEVSITVPCYNEVRSIGATIEAILAIDYPVDRRQILVISDASTDGTDEVVKGYADRGVELLRMPNRGGKTAAENAAAAWVRGELVVGTDATIRIPPDSLKPLVRVFQDPTVGVASGRDLSVGQRDERSTGGEAGYVGYEMWLRGLETRAGSIVGASGCYYAIRRPLYQHLFPEALSRDFACALAARRAGLRSVSVENAVCYVPRSGAIQMEIRRKTRTMARGLETLWFMRELLNPLRYGVFSWMLLSHKLVRWLVFLVAPFSFMALGYLAIESNVAMVLFGLAVVGILLGVLAIWLSRRSAPPKPLATLGFLVATSVAGFVAWTRALRGELNPTWEPTRRQ